ncbi:hypothetical protein B566_EDAN016322 [Ephemera danica]|nr:hypothetical protein B566_EDAN016322 [Ephemera danica]
MLFSLQVVTSCFSVSAPTLENKKTPHVQSSTAPHTHSSPTAPATTEKNLHMKLKNKYGYLPGLALTKIKGETCLVYIDVDNLESEMDPLPIRASSVDIAGQMVPRRMLHFENDYFYKIEDFTVDERDVLVLDAFLHPPKDDSLRLTLTVKLIKDGKKAAKLVEAANWIKKGKVAENFIKDAEDIIGKISKLEKGLDYVYQNAGVTNMREISGLIKLKEAQELTRKIEQKRRYLELDKLEETAMMIEDRKEKAATLNQIMKDRYLMDIYIQNLIQRKQRRLSQQRRRLLQQRLNNGRSATPLPNPGEPIFLPAQPNLQAHQPALPQPALPQPALPQPALPQPALPQPALQMPQPALQMPQPALQMPQPALQMPQPALQMPQPALQMPQPGPPSQQPARCKSQPHRKNNTGEEGSGSGFETNRSHATSPHECNNCLTESADEEKTKKKKTKRKPARDSIKKKSAGPIPCLAISKPLVAVGGLDPEMLECQNIMKPVLKVVQALKNCEETMSKKDKDYKVQERQSLIDIHKHIKLCLVIYEDPKEIKKWKRNLWNFVSNVVGYDAKKLYQKLKRDKTMKAKEDKDINDEDKTHLSAQQTTREHKYDTRIQLGDTKQAGNGHIKKIVQQPPSVPTPSLPIPAFHLINSDAENQQKLESKSLSGLEEHPFEPVQVASANTNNFTHDSLSEIHNAITLRNKASVLKLLENGHTLCHGNDFHRPNCFILAHSVGTWNFIKFLVSLDPKGAIAAKNNEGHTLLMLYAKAHAEQELKYFLTLRADPNQCCDQGNSALLLSVSKLYPPSQFFKQEHRTRTFSWAVSLFINKRKAFLNSCIQVINILVANGAQVTSVNNSNETALLISVKNSYAFHLQIVKSLVDFGTDPTVNDIHKNTVLSYCVETFVDMCKTFKNLSLAMEAFSVLEYLLKLPAFQEDSFKFLCKVEMHPQVIMLKNLTYCQAVLENKLNLLDLICTKKNIFNPTMVILDRVQTACATEEEKLFEPLAFYMNNIEHYADDDHNVTSYVLENMQQLLYFGVRADVRDSISPLTVGLLKTIKNFKYLNFAKCMIESGAPVKQRMLSFKVQDPETEQLTHLDPEVTLELVKIFLPHFSHPGLTLLPFATAEKVATLFPFLSSCGSLQHSALHTKVKQRILDSGCLSEEHLQIFRQNI